MGIKVCYLAGREATYSRTHNVLVALERAGFEVATCFPPDKSPRHYPGLLLQLARKQRGCDLVLVGFYGQLLLPFVRLLARKPVLFDVYASTYSALVEDRKRATAGSLFGRLCWLVDYVALRWAHHVIVDTYENMRRYRETSRTPAERFTRIFLCSDDGALRPCDAQPAPLAGSGSAPRFRVHFHGEYAPFHGVDVIIRAAKGLESEAIDFQIIGTGITHERDRKLAVELGVRNIEFIDRVPYASLGEYMCRADVCLGIFGDNPRAGRELTNKVVEAIAVGRALITRRSAAVEELLSDGESALLIAPGDPQALIDAILRLKNDPELRQRLGSNGQRIFRENCTQGVFSAALKRTIEQLLERTARS